MREIDTHGKTLKEAEEIFHQLLNKVRMEKRHEEVLFITGIGAIQARYVEMAKAQGLHHYIQMNNRGCLVVEFE